MPLHLVSPDDCFPERCAARAMTPYSDQTLLPCRASYPRCSYGAMPSAQGGQSVALARYPHWSRGVNDNNSSLRLRAGSRPRRPICLRTSSCSAGPCPNLRAARVAHRSSPARIDRTRGYPRLPSFTPQSVKKCNTSSLRNPQPLASCGRSNPPPVLTSINLGPPLVIATSID